MVLFYYHNERTMFRGPRIQPNLNYIQNNDRDYDIDEMENDTLNNNDSVPLLIVPRNSVVNDNYRTSSMEVE
jgi:hypothetical protein